MTTTYEAKASTIHGMGVFAKTSFKRGEFIGQYLSRRTQANGTYTLWVETDEGERGYEGFGRLRYVNHTTKPNAEFRERDLHATRSIRVGEEITVHYGEDWKDIS
ncbi:MAG: SET domain-containing protein [Planctomycetota bacterium]